MAHEATHHDQAGLDDGEQEHWASSLPVMERPILLLRGLALLLALVLHFFDRSTEGVVLLAPQMAVLLVGHSALLYLLMLYVRWLRRPLNYLAVDTVVATLAVYLTGGYHSSFFVLYVFIIIGVAFQLELTRTIVVALAIGLIYVSACYLSPASLESPYARYMLAAKVLLLLMVAVLCGLLLEQLRREQQETERERALARRLRTLNELFQHLSTTLSLEHTLQTVAEAPKDLLGADLTTIALLDEDGKHLSVAAATGIDITNLAGVRLTVDDALASAVLSGGRPYAVDEPALFLGALPATPAGQQAVASAASAVSVPLLLNDRPLGILNVVYLQPRTCTEEELAFLYALGQEAALAIRNARLYEREREQVARLETLEELQRGFVSTVSHELRTPLTCIKTSVDLLGAMRNSLLEEQVELLQTIEHHANRLEGLVIDLLEMTKLEAGQITLSKQRTDLRSLVSRVVDTLNPLIDGKGHTVQLHPPGALSLVDVDRRRIEQVLTNILSNAIKFTPKQGQIDICLSETNHDVQVCITDNGPGIPEEDQALIFDKFYVVVDNRGLSGLGLGLYIAREVIDLHGGRIWVESRVGKGSTLCFELPRARPGGEP